MLLAPSRRAFIIPVAYLACVAASIAFAFAVDAQLGGTWLFVVTLPWSALATSTGSFANGMHPLLGPYVAVSTMLAGACCNALLLHWALRRRSAALT